MASPPATAPCSVPEPPTIKPTISRMAIEKPNSSGPTNPECMASMVPATPPTAALMPKLSVL